MYTAPQSFGNDQKYLSLNMIDGKYVQKYQIETPIKNSLDYWLTNSE